MQVDKEEEARKARSKPISIAVTKAALGVAYNMINEVAQGIALGPDTEVTLKLYDSDPYSEVLDGVRMEAFDLAQALLRKIETTSDPYEAFTDCSAIILLDDVEQGFDESKEDWLKRNYELFTHYAKVINEVAKKDVKVLIGGNGPCNFNAFMMIQEAPSIPPQNIMAMSRMTERRAKSVLAQRLNVNSAGVVDVIVWGNPSAGNTPGTTYVDVHRYINFIIII